MHKYHIDNCTLINFVENAINYANTQYKLKCEYKSVQEHNLVKGVVKYVSRVYKSSIQDIDNTSNKSIQRSKKFDLEHKIRCYIDNKIERYK